MIDNPFQETCSEMSCVVDEICPGVLTRVKIMVCWLP